MIQLEENLDIEGLRQRLRRGKELKLLFAPGGLGSHRLKPSIQV
jgi:hypothetical protein